MFDRSLICKASAKSKLWNGAGVSDDRKKIPVENSSCVTVALTALEIL